MYVQLVNLAMSFFKNIRILNVFSSWLLITFEIFMFFIFLNFHDMYEIY
jgi:hypothetical protein